MRPLWQSGSSEAMIRRLCREEVFTVFSRDSMTPAWFQGDHFQRLIADAQVIGFFHGLTLDTEVIYSFCLSNIHIPFLPHPILRPYCCWETNSTVNSRRDRVALAWPATETQPYSEMDLSRANGHQCQNHWGNS